jgi:hypothetical protein
MAAHAFRSTTARMPKYVFLIKNGPSEDYVVDLPDDLGMFPRFKWASNFTG